MNKENIIIVDNSLYITGAFKSILYNCLDLKEHYNFIFIIPKNSKVTKTLEQHNLKFYQFSFREINRSVVNNLIYPFTLIKNGFHLSRIIKSEKAKLVHTNDLFNLIGLVGRLFSTYKVITHVRRLEDSFPKILFTFWVKIHKLFSDQIICVSQICASPFLADNNFTVIYDNLPNKEKYEQYNVRLNPTKLKIIYLANYNNGKGQNLAIESINRVVKSGITNFKMSFVGGHFNNVQNIQFKTNLKKTIDKYNLNSFIELNDSVSDVEKLMKQYDIVLNFSESESFSMVCAEALFFGIPLISTNCGGPAELIEQNITGILIENKSINEMEKAIKLLINSSELREKLSKNSYRLIREKFNAFNPSQELLSIYNHSLK